MSGEVWELNRTGPVVCPICLVPADDAWVDLSDLPGVIPMACGHVPTVTAWLAANATLVEGQT